MKKYKSHILIVVMTLMLFVCLVPCAHAVTTFDNIDELRSDFDSKYHALADDDKGDSEFAASAFAFAATAMGLNPDASVAFIGADIFRFARFSIDFESGPLGGSSYNIIDAGIGMYEAFAVVGMALIFLYFLIEILDEVQADSFTVEHLIKKLITLAIAILVLEQGPDILRYISMLGDTMIDEALLATSKGIPAGEYEEMYQSLYDVVYDDDWLAGIWILIESLGVMVQWVIPYILSWLAVVIAYLTAYSRFMEFLVRFAFAPVGMAQLVSGGAKGAGMRYIKKFAACCISGAVSVAAMGTVPILYSLSSGADAILAAVLVPITLIGFLMKAPRIAEDIVGV